MTRATSGALASEANQGAAEGAPEQVHDVDRRWRLHRVDPSAAPAEADYASGRAERGANGYFALMDSDRVIAKVSTVPTRLRINAHEHDAVWLEGLWVAPESRNGPAAHLLVRECVKALDTTLISTADPDALRAYRDYGQRDFGCMSSFLCVLRPQRFAEALPGLPADAAQERWLALLRRGTNWPGGNWLASGAMRLRARIQAAGLVGAAGARCHSPDNRPDPEQLDLLWERCSDSLRAAPRRDAAYWSTRWSDGDRVISVEDSRGLAGVAILRFDDAHAPEQFSGLRIARVTDFLYTLDRRETAMRLFAGIEAAAHRDSADALVLTASHGGLPWLLRRRGYISISESRRFLARSQRFVLGRLRLSDWWLTGADGEPGSPSVVTSDVRFAAAAE